MGLYEGGVLVGGGPATPVSVANGGTGLASYTAGDLLYASGPTTLSKLAKPGTDNAVLVGAATPVYRTNFLASATALSFKNGGTLADLGGVFDLAAAANCRMTMSSSGSGASDAADILLLNDSGDRLSIAMQGSGSVFGARTARVFTGAIPIVFGSEGAALASLMSNSITRLHLGTDAEAASTTAVYIRINNVMHRITVGAADSGGAGTRLLRVAN